MVHDKLSLIKCGGCSAVLQVQPEKIQAPTKIRSGAPLRVHFQKILVRTELFIPNSVLTQKFLHWTCKTTPKLYCEGTRNFLNWTFNTAQALWPWAGLPHWPLRQVTSNTCQALPYPTSRIPDAKTHQLGNYFGFVGFPHCPFQFLFLCLFPPC